MKSLDRLDLKILSNLQTDARITNQSLAEKVNLSPSSCLQRVKRLEKNGYIVQYLAYIELSNICRYVTCIATIAMRGPGGFEDFVDLIEKMPEVVECSTVSGEFDFILKIVCEDMSRHLEINNYLLKTCDKIESMKTHFVMHESKRFKGFDIESLVPSK